jgi:hypothetical protein
VLRGRKRTTPAPSLQALTAGEVPASLESELRPVLNSGDLRAQALSRATQDPATAALVLRFWLGTAAPEVGSAARV